MSEATAAQREIMRLEVQLEESTRRRQMTRDRLETVQRQLEVDDQQVQIDADKLETARAEARLQEMRRSANVPAPSATVTAEGTASTEAVRGSSSHDHRRRRFALGPRLSSANTFGRSGRGTYGGVTRTTARRYEYDSTANRVVAVITRWQDAHEIFERALRDVGTDAVIELTTANGERFHVFERAAENDP
ncbi:hypothetical protein FIE12Z_5232 [Fusarium flagelliforme]|uniref:Uncharacterized protein n=1 Tax=Fusarium flagelliforme TaxID=2675880 RepID=A0A395MTH0_9HYPO|nr:hypothetical protein FIE12Z_5232 [Fusarium flagelliforme]